MGTKDEVVQVLRMLEERKISQEEAARLLDALQGAPEREGVTRRAEERAAAAQAGPAHWGWLRDLREQLRALRVDVRGLQVEVPGEVEGGWRGPAEGQETASAEERVEWGLREGEEAKVSTVWGDITIEGGEEPRIIAAITAYADSKEEAEELLANVRLEVDGDGGEWRVRPRLPAGCQDRVRVDLKATVRPDTNVKARTMEGSATAHHIGAELELSTKRGGITVCDCGGDVEVSTVEGEVSLRHCGGDLEAHSVNGGVEVQDCHGDVEASTVNGSIKARDCGGDLELSTVNGHVEAKDCGGEVEAHTVNGSVSINDCGGGIKASTTNGEVRIEDCGGDLEVRTVHGQVAVAGEGWCSLEAKSTTGSIKVQVGAEGVPEIEAETQTGGVEVVLPGDARGELDADAGSGTVRCQHPLSASSTSAHAISGLLGEGGNSIRLRSKKGDIVVRKEG